MNIIDYLLFLKINWLFNLNKYKKYFKFIKNKNKFEKNIKNAKK